MTAENVRQTIEQGQRVSQSKLWSLLEAYYVKLGPSAWAKHGTPSFASSNPITAQQYAALTLAFLKDCLANPSLYTLDLTQPLYIFDLGAGSGQFSCAFIKKLLMLLQQNFDQKFNVCLVLMDIVEDNFNFWKSHPEFKSYFDSHLLDYAYYHHAFDHQPIELLNTKRILSPETFSNPLLLIGNYFFSTLPSDLFRLKNGEVQQGLLSSYAPHSKGEADFAIDDPKLIKAITFEVEYQTLTEPAYAGLQQRTLEKLVQTFGEEQEETYFSFPVGGFQVLRYFQKLASERLLLIMGDHGAYNPLDFKKYKDVWLAHHDSLSIPVNFLAFAHFFTLQEGLNLTTAELDPKFLISVSTPKGPKESWKELRFVFEECIEAFNVSDFGALLEDLKSREDPPSIALLLELIKLGRGSALLVKAYHKELVATLPEMDALSKEKLKIYLHTISQNYYFNNSQGGEFFFILGELLYHLEDFAEASANFIKGMQMMGHSKAIYKSLGACYLARGEREAALECFKKAQLLE